MELSWLEDFLTLAEAGSFSRAAELRHVTQPAFSRRIRALEEWVGTPLFDRATHRVILTAAGQQFRPTADQAVRLVHHGRESAREAGSTEATALRFAATHVLSSTFFPEWLRSIEAKAGVGSIRLISDSMQACEQVLIQGQAQFLLCHHHPAAPNRLDPGQFRSVVVGHDTLVPALRPAPAGWAADAGLDAPYLAYSAESGLGRIIAATRGGEGRLLGQQPVVTSHLAAVLRSMACGGRGMAWLPLSLIGDDLERGILRTVGPADWPIPIDIHLFRPRARQSLAAEAFWKRLEDHGRGSAVEREARLGRSPRPGAARGRQ